MVVVDILSEMDIVKFAKDILGVELLPYQEDMLRRMEKGETLVFGMRSGKRTLRRVWDEYLQFKKTSPLEEDS